ncbi:sensor histidine kinase [Nitrospira defluvii]|uniref:histidine kinase n=1 Tax=Nitrospira defluvii TaxID=330214 RepID=A0ABM8RNU1_9BACT|nr:sensor histidine kinase [Nitrospira defluvii]CAE6763128.1 Putative Histidine kinase [Nitrospira defluvii]
MTTQPSHRLVLFAIVVLGIGLYTLDLYLPLGIGNGVLYGGLVVLSLALPDRITPILVASTCSVLALSDVFLGVTFPNVPLWMGLSNRLFSLTAIWFPVIYAFQRRKIEEALRSAHDELEVRVGERTRELALVNQALVEEIGERMETERSLRESESSLKVSQEELQHSREELRALAGQLLTAQEEERRRIARDLHDDVNQRLAMLAMDLRRIEKGEVGDLAMIEGLVRSITRRLTTVSDDVRQMAYRFHPSILDDLGLVKAVRRLVDDFSTSAKIDAVYVHHDAVSPVPTDLATCVYRIAQESLNNVARHAQATEVEVELICDEEVITLSVRDNGVGFDAQQASQGLGRLGLLSMKERVRLVGGSLTVSTAPGRGTHLEVCVPLPGGAHV